MAQAKRIAKSAIDWSTWMKKMPKSEMYKYQAYKGRNDTLTAAIGKLPDALPTLDFAYYKSKVAPKDKAIIEEYEKAYNSLKVPYPKEPTQFKDIDNIDAELKAKDKVNIAGYEKMVAECKENLAKLEMVPPLDHLQPDEWVYYYPQYTIDARYEDHWNWHGFEYEDPEGRENSARWEMQRDFGAFHLPRLTGEGGH